MSFLEHSDEDYNRLKEIKKPIDIVVLYNEGVKFIRVPLEFINDNINPSLNQILSDFRLIEKNQSNTDIFCHTFPFLVMNEGLSLYTIISTEYFAAWFGTVQTKPKDSLLPIAGKILSHDTSYKAFENLKS